MARQGFTASGVDGFREGKIVDPQVPGLSVLALPSGKKTWIYRRRISGSDVIVERRLGLFPRISIAVAREMAAALNRQVEQGIDPRVAESGSMTMDRAHQLYIAWCRKRSALQSEIEVKLTIYAGVPTRLRLAPVTDVSDLDLTGLILSKAKSAPEEASQLADDLVQFFAWATSKRGAVTGLQTNPAVDLANIRFAPAAVNQRSHNLASHHSARPADAIASPPPLSSQNAIQLEASLPSLLTADEFAALLKLSRRMIDRLRKLDLPGFPKEYDFGTGKPGRGRVPRFRRADILAWMETRVLT